MANARVLLPPVLAAAALLAGCSGPDSQQVAEAVETVDVAAAAEARSGSVEQGRGYDTWEEAAIAEAQRLHPELTELTAERVDLTTLDERVVVRASSGFCGIYGGMAVEGRWRADEVMVLSADCGGS